MKILLISNMYPNKENPQYGIFVKKTEEIIINNGFEINKVIMYKKNRIIKKIISYINFYIKVLVNLIFRNYSYVYVHYVSHSSLPVIISKLIKPSIQIISNVHGSDVIPENGKQKYFNYFSSKILKLSLRVVAPSNYYKKLIENKYNIEDKKIIIFPSGGIDENEFYPIDDSNFSKEKLNLSIEFKYIGFVSRLDYGKGWNVFLDAAHILSKNKSLSNYKFIVVGNGHEEKLFYKKINELNLGDRVIHLNFLSHDKLKYLYNSLEIFCFPTNRAGESLGLVGIEALSCGIPVIASNFAGPTDYIIDNYNGYLFEKNNSVDLSKKIEKYIVLKNDKKKQFKINSFESSKKYYRKNVEKILIDIFKN